MGYHMRLFLAGRFIVRPAVVLSKATAVIIMLAFLGGCGDTFRPVSNPIAQPGGDPSGTVEHAIVLSANFTAAPSGNTGVPASGTTMHIDVSGDTVVAVENVSINPVHAAIIGGNVVVANKGAGTLSVYPVTAGPNASVQTGTLTSAAQPVFVASTDNTNIYVAEPNINTIDVVPLATFSALPGGITDPSI